jgi:hypothetical protein
MTEKPSKYERHLEENLMIIALVIKHHGAVFWPTYYVIEKELERCRSERSKLGATLLKLEQSRVRHTNLELT